MLTSRPFECMLSSCSHLYIFGFALLLPGFRKALARKLKAKFAKSMINAQNANGKSAGFRKRDDDVIDI